jgi:ATPase subunit of ABC transporter with duplicated ATPase domains
VRKRDSKVTFKLPVPARAGAVPMTITDLSVVYGTKTILKRTNLLVGRGDRVVVLGRNGVGKSSMLRCLAGVQAPTKGSIRLGTNTSVGYFAQEHEQIDREISSLSNLDDVVLKTDGERRALLGSFGLTGDKADQLPGTLSGGERAKLGLAMIAAGRNNLLILDEPTNNLDPASVVAIGEMLARWEGTLIVVSHERAFVEALEPTHAMLLPDEFYDLWRDEYLDEVEQR